MKTSPNRREKRNPTADAKTDGNINAYSQTDCESHSKGENNPETNSEADVKANP